MEIITQVLSLSLTVPVLLNGRKVLQNVLQVEIVKNNFLKCSQSELYDVTHEGTCLVSETMDRTREVKKLV